MPGGASADSEAGRVKVVLDPNVLVSAAISPHGPPRELLHRWRRGAFEVVSAAEILFELQEVLSRPKFRRYLTLEEVRDYLLWLHDGAVEISEELDRSVLQGVTGDPDDDYIAGVAYLGGADVIVSGDPHLSNLDAIRRGDGGVIARVLTPRAPPGEARPGEQTMTYKLTYDPESGVFYIRVREGEYAETMHPGGAGGEDFGVDVDEEGSVLGVAFLSFEEYAEVIARSGGKLEIPE